MNTFVRTALYVAFMLAVFCVEHDVPVMLYVRRTTFLMNWKIATFTHHRALNSYRAYQEEAEIAHG